MISFFEETLNLELIPGVRDILQLRHIFLLISEPGLTPCFFPIARICRAALSATWVVPPWRLFREEERCLIASSASLLLSEVRFLERLPLPAIFTS